MATSFSYARLLAIVVSVLYFPATCHAADVAPSPRPVPFTAFPTLKAYEPAEDRWFALPALAPDASPLRKVRHAQATAAFLYLAKEQEMIREGVWYAHDLLNTLCMTREAFRRAAEMENTLANRLPWYEERVRAMNSLE